MVNSSGSFIETLGMLLKESPGSQLYTINEGKGLFFVFYFYFFPPKKSLAWVTAGRGLKTQPSLDLQSKMLGDE